MMKKLLVNLLSVNIGLNDIKKIRNRIPKSVFLNPLLKFSL